MSVYELDPLKDPRWVELLQRHSKASVFHTPGWLEALRRTYGYHAVALTTTPPGQPLQSGLVFCRVKSWLTGYRIVSLPFADHCEPLVDNADSLIEMLTALQSAYSNTRSKYVELRPLTSLSLNAGTPFRASESFCFHSIDLRTELNTILRGFHKSCVLRKIQRAQREKLTVDVGRSEEHLRRLYMLLLRTRRRHQLPPQPLAWFRNLVACLGQSVTIRTVHRGDQPIASILTLSYKQTLIYKYGCSDERFHNLGGMPLLFWCTIQEGKSQGAQILDLGRSELTNAGLINFKDHLGASRSELTYYRYPSTLPRKPAHARDTALVRKVFACLPDCCLTVAGKLLYKHAG